MHCKPEYPRLGVSPRPKARVLFSPVNLTANGRAHLGHAGGPFLRMDVLSRTLKRAGHDVWSGLTTDGFENHVVLGARARGEDPAAMANRFHELIRDDLAALGIRFDRFDNPSHPENIARFAAVKDSLLAALHAGGKVVLVGDQLPVDDALPDSAPIEERFAVGAWFSARCPRCHGQAGSFFCEACGAHFEPGEALEPASRRGTITHWAKNRSYFLRIDDATALPRMWEKMHVEAPFVRIAQRHIDIKGSTMRLTVPGLYGLAWSSANLVNRQICFSYSSLLYAHSLYCGERHAESCGGSNDFARAGDAYLIGATGIDNTIPMLIGVSGCALAQDTYRPFDRLYYNYFLSLEGRKFSTSRGHVIWARDIATTPNLDVDLLRVYLSEVCPEEQETDFRIEALVERHNALLERVNGGIEAAMALLEPRTAPPAFDDRLLSKLEVLLREQLDALSLDLLRVSYAWAPVMAWLEDANSLRSASEAYTWLKGLAFLGWPIMCTLCEDLWRWLGHDGAPRSEDFFKRPVLSGDAPVALRGRRLTVADLQACLPEASLT